MNGNQRQANYENGDTGYYSKKGNKSKGKSSKLEPLFDKPNGSKKHLSGANSSQNLISPQSRSQYGKFQGKVKGRVEAIKKSRGGSGGRNRQGSKPRLSPLPSKPSKRVPKHK